MEREIWKYSLLESVLSADPGEPEEQEESEQEQVQIKIIKIWTFEKVRKVKQGDAKTIEEIVEKVRKAKIVVVDVHPSIQPLVVAIIKKTNKEAIIW